MPNIAFHGSPDVQAKYVNRVVRHYFADEIVQGIYWREGKGCAVGCLAHVDGFHAHAALEDQIGLPADLARVMDGIFESLDNQSAKDWPLAVITTLPLGANLTGIWPKFAAWLLTDPEWSVFQERDTKPLAEELAAMFLAGQMGTVAWSELGDRIRHVSYNMHRIWDQGSTLMFTVREMADWHGWSSERGRERFAEAAASELLRLIADSRCPDSPE